MTPADPKALDCAGCALDPGRRTFILDGLALAAGVLASLGVTEPAVALPVGWIRSVLSDGQTATYPIPAEDGVQIDRDQQVILVRWQGAVYAFSLSCPHQRTALRWIGPDAIFQCPKHKSKYQPDGTFISGKATRNMDRYPLHRTGDSVVVDVDIMYKQDKDPAGWGAALVRLA